MRAATAIAAACACVAVIAGALTLLRAPAAPSLTVAVMSSAASPGGAPGASGGAPDAGDIYVGPEIGSVAKVEWPELVGRAVEDAVAAIEAERPDLLMVRPTKEVRRRRSWRAGSGRRRGAARRGVARYDVGWGVLGKAAGMWDAWPRWCEDCGRGCGRLTDASACPAAPHAQSQGSIVSMDFAVRRVRVYYDPGTNKVTQVPRVG